MNLVLLCLFFFLISFIYARGMMSVFRYNFRWHLASVVGIASVVLCTAQFVWKQYDYLTYEQAVIDLFLVFLAALPGMAWHGKTYLAEQRQLRRNYKVVRSDLIEARIRIETLTDERKMLKEEILPLLSRVNEGQNDTMSMLNELASILQMRLWAEQELEKRNN